jgi:hypothetical protein
VYTSKSVQFGLYNRSIFVWCECKFLSVGHYPCYGSPDFSIIKSFSAVVFPLGFFQGFIPKNIGVLCVRFFVS